MFDRHAFGDLAFAVLLALPLISLTSAHPATTSISSAPAALSTATTDRAPGKGRISLLG
jgi:hypothetical protein